MLSLTVPSFSDELLKLAREDSVWSSLAAGLPAATIMTPVTFGKNYLEQGMMVGIQERLGRQLDRSHHLLQNPWALSPGKKRIHQYVVKKLSPRSAAEAVLTSPAGRPMSKRFVESLGRGIGASTIGFGVGLLQMALINRMLAREKKK